MKNLLSLWSAKLTGWIIKEYSLGSGSTWPGHVALKINPHFISNILKDKELTIVLIAGTNGKTTTAKMLRHILEDNGFHVFQNEEGANLLNGMATAVIKHLTIFGTLKKDALIFEVDENNLPKILEQITPHAIVLLNLFRDQLDRYGEVNSIAHKWEKSLSELPSSTHFIFNADDPQINYIGSKLHNVTYFGLPAELMRTSSLGHDVDSIYCPDCGSKLSYMKISYSHIGDYVCKTCGFKRHPVKDFKPTAVNIPLAGLYNRYNMLASYFAARETFGLDDKKVIPSIEQFKPAFGRQEHIDHKGRKITVLLSKNPTGFNQSIQAVKEMAENKKVHVVLLLNDRIPDGTDVSWIWDIDLENLLPLTKRITVSGDRPYDMALRLKYVNKNQNFDNSINIVENIQQALTTAVDQTPKGEQLFILPTYSAMLDARKILTGKSIL